jgi:hypothetical protein
MMVTLNLPPHVERAYLAAAQARGLQLADLVLEVLVASQPSGAPSQLSPEEWIREYRACGRSYAHDNLPALSDEEIRWEAIYDALDL